MVLSFAGAAFAQEPATLLLKSGERISGQLVDMTGSAFIMTVNGQERRIRIDDAAVIDFSGHAQNLPPAESQKAGQGQNLLVLKSGQQIQGKLEDVGGRHPLRVSFVKNGVPTNYRSNEISRVYLATPISSAVATSGAGTPAGQPGAATGNGVTVHVPANRQWTATGVNVQQGQTISFSSSGQVQLSTDPGNTSTVNGKPGLQPARSQMPGTLGGALVGRIGNGTPFAIGSLTSIVAPGTGPLYLGVNDDLFNDNSGEFVVVVTGGTPGSVRGRLR
jgi:hypothetical protein